MVPSALGSSRTLAARCSCRADTAEAKSMPRAAVQSGAADLILPLHELGEVLGQLVAGGRLPRLRTGIEAAESLFAGPGDVRQLARAVDWSGTPLGPVTQWP